MTLQEMIERIIQTIGSDKRGGGVSLSELVEACGAEAKGDRDLEYRKNLLLWRGVSEIFLNAFWKAYPRLRIKPLPEELIGAGVRWLPLPLAAAIREYKRPHWLAVVIFLRTEGQPASEECRFPRRPGLSQVERFPVRPSPRRAPGPTMLPPYNIAAMQAALRVLASITDHQEPARADLQILRELAPEFADGPLDDLACHVIEVALRNRRAATRNE